MGLGVREAEPGPAFEVAHSFPGAEIRVSGFSEGWSYQTPSGGLRGMEATPSLDPPPHFRLLRGHRPVEWKGLASRGNNLALPAIPCYRVMSASLYFLEPLLLVCKENIGQSKPPKGTAGGLPESLGSIC